MRRQARRLPETTWPWSSSVRGAAVFLAVLVLAPPATAARKVIYGVNDGNFASAWATMAPRIAGLGLDQVGVWVRYRCADDNNGWLVRGLPTDLGQVPASQPALVQLVGSPSCSPRTPSQRSVYGLFARELVLHYPQIRELQVWNEPDLAFWSGSARNYVRLLAAVHDALRGTNVKVLGPGFSPNGLLQPCPRVQMNTASFARAVRGFYRAHRHRRSPILDGFAYHPYQGFDHKMTATLARILDKSWSRLPQPGPRRGLRFWWTETGAESLVSGAAVDEFGRRSDGYFGVPNRTLSPEFQANRVATVALKARAYKLVVADFNFQLGDDWNLARWQSGLYFAGGQPKPAYFSFREAISRARR